MAQARIGPDHGESVIEIVDNMICCILALGVGDDDVNPIKIFKGKRRRRIGYAHVTRFALPRAEGGRADG